MATSSALHVGDTVRLTRTKPVVGLFVTNHTQITVITGTITSLLPADDRYAAHGPAGHVSGTDQDGARIEMVLCLGTGKMPGSAVVQAVEVTACSHP